MSVCGDCVEYDRENSVYGWCKRYNNSKVYENDSACLYFEETRSSSGTGCFLTTACCEYKGLPDDCHELTIMRKFRDEYLKSKQYGKEMIDAYYERAPKIVERINQSDRKNEMLDYIYKEIYRLHMPRTAMCMGGFPPIAASVMSFLLLSCHVITFL